APASDPGAARPVRDPDGARPPRGSARRDRRRRPPLARRALAPAGAATRRRAHDAGRPPAARAARARRALLRHRRHRRRRRRLRAADAARADVRGVEIDPRVADSDAALVVDQVRAGLVVRMAVLYDLLTRGPVLVETAVEVA